MEKAIEEKIRQIEAVLSSRPDLITERIEGVFPNISSLIVRDVNNHFLIEFSPETYLYPASCEVAHIDITNLANERAKLTLLKNDVGYSWRLNNNILLGQLVNCRLTHAQKQNAHTSVVFNGDTETQ